MKFLWKILVTSLERKTFKDKKKNKFCPTRYKLTLKNDGIGEKGRFSTEDQETGCQVLQLITKI